MKNHVINKDKIIEAYIQEPWIEQTIDGPVRRGYCVCFILEGGEQTILRSTRDLSEFECIEFLNSLGFIPLDVI